MMKKRLCFGKRLYCSIVALSLFVMCSNNLFAVNKSSSENTSTVHDFQQSAGEDALDFIFISDDENGILDYRQKTITYYQGMIEGDPKTQVVAIDSPVIVTDMGFKFNRLVLLGWHTTKVKPLFVTTLAAENDLILSGDFYGIGDTLITSVDMPLYAVWALDMNNDGYPDYKQKTITYYQGMIEGDPKTQAVAIDSPVIVTDMGFKFNRLVLLGWHTTKVKPLFVTTLAAENDLILSGDFYGIGDTLITSVDMPLYAVWALDMNNDGYPDYKQKTITYYQGMIEGDPKTQVVAIDSPIIVTDMGFKFNRLVLLGWHTTKVKPLFVTTLAAENDLILSGDFYGIGDTLITSVDMPLYAVWAMDMNNDGYPDYPGSGIIKPKSRSMELRDGESTGSEEIVGVRVWSYDNTLYIDSDKSVRVNIYTLGGMLFKQLEMAEGLTSEVMQRGMYIVEIDGLRYKVIVK